MTTPIFHDSFDQYGAPGVSQAVLTTLVQQYWTQVNNSNIGIIAGLSATGYAFQFQGQNSLLKTLTANYSRIIGTHRFQSNLGGGVGTHCIQFRDTSNNQCCIVVEGSGTINLRSGGSGGTILAGGGAVTANSTHVLSWDITFGATAAYQVWLDGLSLFSGTGNTRAGSTNNYANAITVGTITGNATVAIDDFAMVDGSLAFDAGMLTTNPRLETQFGTADVQKQFASGATILGEAYILTANTNAPGANQIFLRRFIPEANETINSVSILPVQTSATAKFKAGLYPDSGGSPNGQTRLSDGTEIVGCTNGTILAAPLATPTALTAGTPYWLAIIGDTGITLAENDIGTNGVRAAATYTSGVPATCPTVTTGQNNWVMYGNCTGAAANWPAVKHAPAPGDISYVGSSTVGDEDLLNFPALSTNPTKIFFGAVMANVKRSDAGARTLDLRTKSSATDSAGSTAGQSPALSYGWLNSYFPTDPNTGIDWTPAGWNGASSGYKIAA